MWIDRSVLSVRRIREERRHEGEGEGWNASGVCLRVALIELRWVFSCEGGWRVDSQSLNCGGVGGGKIEEHEIV